MLRYSVLTALLALLLGVAVAQAPADQSAVVKLVSVQPSKILYDVGEPITGSVVVKNLKKSAAGPPLCGTVPGAKSMSVTKDTKSAGGTVTVTVRAWLAWELDSASKPLESKLTIEPGKEATATFMFSHLPARYGHALKAQVWLNNKLVAEGEDYFNVCDNFWNVALINGAGPGTAMEPGNIARMRNGYYNSFEIMFWAPDDFLGLTPTTDSWLSGQARYAEVKTGVVDFPHWGKVYGLKDGIALAHRYGMKVVTYAKLTGGGTYGMEMARRHPEMVWQNSGTLSVIRAAESRARWDDRSVRNLPQGWLPVDYNMNDPKVVDIGIKSLSDSATMFGWDGARWDGNFDVRTEVFDLDGKSVEKLTSEQVDAHNAANMRRTKDYISHVHPRFVYGYNWTQGNWGQSLASNPRESMELCRNGGLIMNEYINGAAGVQHPLHRWDIYGPSVADDVERIKQLGGYYGPILSSNNTADGKYTDIFAYAAGAHPYYHHLWGAFMTRYSAFCWDNALTRIHNPDNLLLAPNNVWWRHWVFERPLDGSHKQLILHLINPPAKSTVGEGPTLADVPVPLKDVAVTVFPNLLHGWTPVKATRLSPEPMLQEDVPIKLAEGVYEMKVPEIPLWTILVIDLVKKRGR